MSVTKSTHKIMCKKDYVNFLILCFLKCMAVFSRMETFCPFLHLFFFNVRSGLYIY